MQILLVDDDRVNRMIIARHLAESGYEVIHCADGREAWERIRAENFSLVITDWIMPRMDGIALCRKIRETQLGRYVYVIMLTARDQKQDLIQAMEAGADDFLVKPVGAEILHACLRAGERILALERRLEERNRKLTESRDRLQNAYRVMHKDLQAAARVQESLIPKKRIAHAGVRFHWLFQPCAQVAGDIFNCFPMDERHLGFYLLDVSGHGIPAAMLSVMISKLLVPDSGQDNLLKRSLPEPPYYRLVAPDDVVRELNRRFQSDDAFSRYFTMIYGIIDRMTGVVRLCQAGHPHPVLLRRGGEPETVGQSGFPVGILPELEYGSYRLQLSPGDRFFLYSDGIPGCTNDQDETFGQDRMVQLLSDTHRESLVASVAALDRKLREWNGPDAFVDDMTLLAVEYTGTQPAAKAPEEQPRAHRVIEIEGLLDQAIRVRRFINAFLDQDVPNDHCDPEGCWAMELAIHETVTNVIRHALDRRANTTVRIECLAFAQRLEFLITYDGRTFDPQKVPEARLDGSQTAHFGLYLVDRCMDEIDYQTFGPGEKRIRLTKHLARREPR